MGTFPAFCCLREKTGKWRVSDEKVTVEIQKPQSINYGIPGIAIIALVLYYIVRKRSQRGEDVA